MINKFLYDIDIKGKKILYGIVEDEHEGSIELGSEIEYSFMGDVNPDEISRNLGGQCFVVFNDNGVKKYLDIDFYKDRAKIQLTEKIAYALPLSEDIIDIILDYLDINLEYEVIYGCFYEHPKKGTVDILERQFKGLFADSYVQIFKEGISYFLGQNEEYFLTRNLREAKKFHKTEIRKILIINKFVTRETQLKELYFSPYQLLRGEDEFFMLYPKPMMVSKIGDDFIVNTKEIKITNNHLLCKSELINGKMKEIQSLLNKEEELEKGYGLCYSKYLEVKDNIFTLSDDPSKLSLVSKSSISLFASIYTIFSESEVTFLPEQNLVYVYEIEDNKFKVTSSSVDVFVSSNVIKDSVYYDFLKHFVSKSLSTLDKGFILSVEDKFLSIEMLENNEFRIEYNDSSYDATVFSDEQCKVIRKILKFDTIRKELTNLLTNSSKYNITNKEVKFDIVKEYNTILNDIKNNKFKMCMYNKSEIKLESEKGSLEYLRRFYFKAINDSEILFNNVLNKQEINNVLLVDSVLNLDLIALNNVAVKLNKKINVSLIIQSKAGYYPKANLSNLNINGIYKVDFSSMPKVFLSKFDLILFSRAFGKQGPSFEATLKNIINNQNVVLANIKHCGLGRVVDSFADTFSKIKRKHFVEYDKQDEIINASRNIFEDMHDPICKCSLGLCEVTYPIVEKQFSYHSVVIVKDKKIFDLY